jgi:CheY-specific phosphatase CheX
MDEKTRASAGQVLQEVLERQAFLFVDPAEGGESLDSGLLTTSLRFAGACAGGLSLAAPMELAREIAAGILGCEPDDPMAEERAGDACKELLNITCGQALTTWFGTAPVFDLGIPESRLLSPEEAADWTAAPDVLAFSVDGRPLFMRIDLALPPGGAPA